MSETAPPDRGETVFREYVLDVRILEVPTSDGDSRYCFEAPGHERVVFDAPEAATLYADVYFDVNGFAEAGTGERGVPPEIVQAGRDTMAAYFLTRPDVDLNWLASFYGKRRSVIQRYVSNVRARADEIRQGARERDVV